MTLRLALSRSRRADHKTVRHPGRSPKPVEGFDDGEQGNRLLKGSISRAEMMLNPSAYFSDCQPGRKL